MSTKKTTTSKLTRRVKATGRAHPAFLAAAKKSGFKSAKDNGGVPDPRINRKGYIKPKSQRQLEELLDLLFNEKVILRRSTVDEEGKKHFTDEEMSRLEYMLIHMIGQGDSRDRSEILARRFGKQKEVDPESENKPKADFTLPADLIAPDFLAVWRDILKANHLEYLLKGGRGSTKSSFIALAIITLLKKHKSIHALAMRQVGATLRDSVFNKLQWAITELGVSDEFKCTTSPLEITYIPTGQKIYFRGADDPGKVKSITPAFGYIGILWLEELDQFKGVEAVRKIEQSVIRGGEVGFIFKSYNPPQTSLNWVNKYTMVPKDTQYQHSSTYLTVPPEWLGKVWLDEAEHLKATNPKAYDHEYLGAVNGLGTNVFDNIELRELTDEEVAQFDNIKHGQDWGYYPDPAHYSQSHYDAARHTLYIFGEVRKWKTGNRELYDAIRTEGGYRDQDLLIADSAEPKSVGDFRAYGAVCRGAEKGPDSVKYSIKWLQSLKAIVIDPKRCPYAAEEFVNYQHEVSKDGEIISAYPDKDNHAIDSVRYATNLIWRRRGE